MQRFIVTAIFLLLFAGCTKKITVSSPDSKGQFVEFAGAIDSAFKHFEPSYSNLEVSRIVGGVWFGYLVEFGESIFFRGIPILHEVKLIVEVNDTLIHGIYGIDLDPQAANGYYLSSGRLFGTIKGAEASIHFLLGSSEQNLFILKAKSYLNNNSQTNYSHLLMGQTFRDNSTKNPDGLIFLYRSNVMNTN